MVLENVDALPAATNENESQKQAAPTQNRDKKTSLNGNATKELAPTK